MTALRRSFAALIAGLLATAALTSAPAARATLITITPGERVDYISPTGNSKFCTLGYVYTGLDLHVYAVTAGHCRSTPGGYVRTTRSGHSGTFVRTIVEPRGTGGADYGLIDFGTEPFAVSYIDDIPAGYSHPEPQPGQTICRTGVSSGQHCGQIVSRQGDDQYLTTGMPSSTPGDSGGPVWTRHGDAPAKIIGIWLGERTTPGANGIAYGRFASLAEGLRILGAP